MIGFPEKGFGLVYLTNSLNGLSIMNEKVSIGIGGEHPAFFWDYLINYTTYDAPASFFYASCLHWEPTARLPFSAHWKPSTIRF